MGIQGLGFSLRVLLGVAGLNLGALLGNMRRAVHDRRNIESLKKATATRCDGDLDSVCWPLRPWSSLGLSYMWVMVPLQGIGQALRIWNISSSNT